MKRLLCALLLCLCGTQLWAAGFSATVDRARLNEGETFDLILESEDVSQFGMPVLTALRDQFEVVSTRQENRLSTFAGQARSSTRWIVTLLRRHIGEFRLSLALTMVLGGALGNVIDRIRLGAVVDFIQWHVAGYNWPAFNVADMAVVGGMALLVVVVELEERRSGRRSRDAHPQRG